MNKQIFQQIVDEQLNLATQRTRRVLVPLEELSESQMRDLLGAYRAAIEPNFIPWMQRAYVMAKSEIAKQVLLKNIEDELLQDHPQMLRDFTTSLGVRLEPQHYAHVSQPVFNIWSLLRNDNNLTNVTLAATLEHTSLTFIPYLADLGKLLDKRMGGGANFTYTDVHGQEDVAHAQALYQGLLEEMHHAISPWRTVATAVDKTTTFLENIFTPLPHRP